VNGRFFESAQSGDISDELDPAVGIHQLNVRKVATSQRQLFGASWT